MGKAYSKPENTNSRMHTSVSGSVAAFAAFDISNFPTMQTVTCLLKDSMHELTPTAHPNLPQSRYVKSPKATAFSIVSARIVCSFVLTHH